MDQQHLLHDLRERRVIGRGHEHEPLADYALIATTFLTCTGAAVAAALRRRSLPRELPLRDALLLGLATTRLSRLVTREKVTRVVRAPFTEVEPGATPDQVKERPRGDGVVRAIGELVTCPRCVGVWASGALSIAYVFAPEPTRFAAGLLTASLVSDYANLIFARTREALS